MSDAPRTIWATDANGDWSCPGGEWGCDGIGHRYHHDDVVRELAAALEAALSDCMDEDGGAARDASLHWIWDARAALAKLAD